MKPKTLLTLSVALIWSLANVCGQGTLHFGVDLLSYPAQNSSQGGGNFTLTGNIFGGRLNVEGPGNISFMEIRSRNGRVLLPASRWQPFPPSTIDHADWDAAVLTSGQVADLLSGAWFVSVGTPETPEGIFRGDLVLVPEPSSLALASLLTVGITVFIRQRLSR